jgi:adenylate cyclase
MANKATQRKLAAILSADVVGYSRLMGADEEATIETLTAYRKVFLSQIESHRGRVVDAKGDAILAEFASVVDAVSSATEIQRELAEQNAALPDDRRMDFRIGINLGDVVVKDDVIYGDGVNVAARLESLAEPGGICISRPVYDQVESKLNLDWEYLGEQQVKNIAKPVRAYSVRAAATSTKVEVEIASESTSSNSKSPDQIAPPTLAVLPFVNISGDAEQEYFSDGITEDLITDLSKLTRLSVTARNTAFTYKGKAVNVQQVGKELSVRYVLEGSVRKAGNRVRITAQLIDTDSGNHIWAERYDRTLEDTFVVQDEITRNIVTALDVKLLEGEQAKIWRKSTQSAEAYDLFLQGQNHYRKNQSSDGVDQARRLFEQAVDLDPNFARAIAGLAHMHFMNAFLSTGVESRKSLETSFELANRAITLDDSLAYAYSVIGMNYVVSGQHDRAIVNAERAVRLNPNSGDIVGRLGVVETWCGKPESGIRNIRKAMLLTPHYPPWYLRQLGLAQLFLEQYEEAIDSIRESIARAPDLVFSHVYLAAAYEGVDRDKEAQNEVQEILRLEPGFNLQRLESGFVPRDKAHGDRLLDLLRQAGLPE